MNKERACNIILRSLMTADNCTMSREDITALLLQTRYASTALSHCIAYCNDMKVYHSAIVVYKKNNKTVTHVTLANVMRFNKETGFALTVEQIADRNAKIAEIATSLAIENEVTMSENRFTCDSDVKMSDCLTIDESAIVSMRETVLMLTDDSESTRHQTRVESVLNKHSLTIDESNVITLAHVASKSKRTRKSVAA